MARWVVVGGTGYIGEALCLRLQSDGQQVLSVSRALDGPVGCEHHTLELSLDSDFPQIFQAGDRVIYAAGLASRAECERHPDLARWLNSDCPVELLRRADAAGVESFTYLSSVKAMCPPRGVLANEDVGAPATDHYGRSKWQGEQQLLLADSRCRLNIIRPASVYGEGPGGAESAGRARRWQAVLGTIGRLAPLLPASGRRSFICLHDLLEAICLLAQSTDCNRQVLIAAEPTFYDLAGIVSAISGAPARGSRRLTRWMLAPLRPLRQLGGVRKLLELEQSELYSAARLRALLPWRAQGRYSEFLRGAG
ncbi:NAD-dependent epimerase/dehydratase family protein [Microbulbifer hainanensis]|uniref:NAD-dependent epimerase/dehydratase family protein n=1 Tax=Microbulbifer hainanensis TaxID=2735675 RepID=UPI001866DBF3|nr:NAD-dependent epimerase/dehydratase family protein [Microbulbifer hainanensis]